MIEKKILLAEDDKGSANLLEKLLTRFDYQVNVMPNGLKAYNALKHDKYHLLLTDWMMPQMDGIELIRKVRKELNPAPIIVMITALKSMEARNHALTSGADDFITKPYKIDDILKRINDLFLRKNQESPDSTKLPLITPEKNVPFAAVCVAASSGGPQTLLNVFKSFPATKNAAIFIVQHGPAWALKDMSARWDRTFNMKVTLGEDGTRIEPQNIYIAPGNYHMVIDPDTMTLKLDDGPPENYIKPAADPLFRSVAKTFGSKSIAVIMTGMGLDGSEGAKHIAAAQGKIIIQNPETAIVKSMPQAAMNTLPEAIVVSDEEIAETIIKNLKLN